MGQVVIDLGGINGAAISQDPSYLVLEDGGLQQARNPFHLFWADGAQRLRRQGVVVEKIAFHQAGRRGGLDVAVHDARPRGLEDRNHRFRITLTAAAHFDDRAIQSVLVRLALEGLQDLDRAGRAAAGGGPHEDPRFPAALRGLPVGFCCVAADPENSWNPSRYPVGAVEIGRNSGLAEPRGRRSGIGS